MFSEEEKSLLQGRPITKIVLFCKRLYRGHIIDDLEKKFYFVDGNELHNIVFIEAKKYSWIRVYVGEYEQVFETKSRVFDISLWPHKIRDSFCQAEPERFSIPVSRHDDDIIKTGISFYDAEKKQQVLICDRKTALDACSVLIKNKSPFVRDFIQFAGRL